MDDNNHYIQVTPYARPVKSVIWRNEPYRETVEPLHHESSHVDDVVPEDSISNVMTQQSATPVSLRGSHWEVITQRLDEQEIKVGKVSTDLLRTRTAVQRSKQLVDLVQRRVDTLRKEMSQVVVKSDTKPYGADAKPYATMAFVVCIVTLAIQLVWPCSCESEVVSLYA